MSGTVVGTAQTPTVEAPPYPAPAVGAGMAPAAAAAAADSRPGGAASRRSATSRVVVRRVDPWSVLKVSILFYLSVCIVLLVAGVLLWAAASSAGVVDNIESFMDAIGFTGFRFLPGQILRGAALGGLVLVVAGTFANVLLAMLYNLIGDVVGGVSSPWPTTTATGPAASASGWPRADGTWLVWSAHGAIAQSVRAHP